MLPVVTSIPLWSDRQSKPGILARFGCGSKPTTLTYETDLLEKTIRRIAGLLQVGFGEAGAQVIAQNLKVCAVSCDAPFDFL
jgi:hypothetical protein